MKILAIAALSVVIALAITPGPVKPVQSVPLDPSDVLLAQSEAEGALARQEAADGCRLEGCLPVYYCPTSGEEESPCHGGFDVCCDAPELHVPVSPQ